MLFGRKACIRIINSNPKDRKNKHKPPNKLTHDQKIIFEGHHMFFCLSTWSFYNSPAESSYKHFQQLHDTPVTSTRKDEGTQTHLHWSQLYQDSIFYRQNQSVTSWNSWYQGFKYRLRSRCSFVMFVAIVANHGQMFVDIVANRGQMRPILSQL